LYRARENGKEILTASINQDIIMSYDISRDIIRGKIMTEAMFYTLLSLLKPGHGYGIMRRIRELSGNRVQMGPGTLYGVLTRMRKEEWILLESEGDRRKIYKITQTGREALKEEYARLKQMVQDGSILEEEDEETV